MRVQRLSVLTEEGEMECQCWSSEVRWRRIDRCVQPMYDVRGEVAEGAFRYSLLFSCYRSL